MSDRLQPVSIVSSLKSGLRGATKGAGTVPLAAERKTDLGSCKYKAECPAKYLKRGFCINFKVYRGEFFTKILRGTGLITFYKVE
ncbi:hypothetical protein SUGI_0879500 [Cryptomeria japonica]|nr:hypothetical protein SUGI_0879500 [Cryptomeria japonica]